MPGKPFQSKLVPFYDFIRACCREKRWSYPRIAVAITTEHGIKVSANAVFSFVKVRSRKRRILPCPKHNRCLPLFGRTVTRKRLFEQQPTQPKNHERKRYKLDL